MIVASSFLLDSPNVYKITVNATADASVVFTVPAGAAEDISKNPNPLVLKTILYGELCPLAMGLSKI